MTDTTTAKKMTTEQIIEVVECGTVNGVKVSQLVINDARKILDRTSKRLEKFNRWI